LGESYDEVDEMVRIVARLAGVAIGLLIIIPVFKAVLNIDVREFFASIAEPTFTSAVAR